MEWAEFQRDHHRPHLLVVSVAARKASDPPTEAPDLERLAVRLGTAGNYAFSVEGTTLLAAFEVDGDAERFAQVFRPTQITRESEWASKAWARMDGATLRRIADILASVHPAALLVRRKLEEGAASRWTSNTNKACPLEAY